MNPDDGDRSEVHERCDGCRHPHPASELSLIGDGSIKGCQTCRAEATGMVREQNWECHALPGKLLTVSGHSEPVGVFEHRISDLLRSVHA
jgi:hypothetical protein